jgi:carbon-monoxide dehydrogenase medium subunit
VAVQLNVSGGKCNYAGIGITNLGLTPIKATQAEGILSGSALDDATLHSAANVAAAATEPNADYRGSEDYKRSLVKTLTMRALRTAMERAKG